MRIYADGRQTNPAPADAALVFGAAVWGSRLSPELEARIDRAAELHACGLAGPIVCCGGVTDGISEAAEMRRQLIARGVPAERIVVSDDGGSTRKAMEAAAALAHRRWNSFLLVSSPYHMHRVLCEARRRGLHARGAPARIRPALRSRGSGFDRRLLIYRASQHIREIGAAWWYALPLRPSTIEVRKAAKAAHASAQIAGAVARDQLGGLQVPPDGADRPVALSPPVAAPISSGFGWRSPRHHDGVDFRTAYGTPVRSAGAGLVVLARKLPMYGWAVAVAHGAQLSTVYGHLSQLDVEPGDEVDAGQPIGGSGSSGNAFGPHLHFEVRVDGVPVDPGHCLQLDSVAPSSLGPAWVESAIWMLRRLGSITALDHLQGSGLPLARPAPAAMRTRRHIPARARLRGSP